MSHELPPDSPQQPQYGQPPPPRFPLPPRYLPPPPPGGPGPESTSAYQDPGHSAGTPPQPPRPSHRTRNILLSIGGAVVVIIAVTVAAALASNGKIQNGNNASVLCPGGYYASSRAACNATANTEAPPSPPAPADTEASLAVGQQLSITQNGTPAGTVTITSVSNSTQPADSFGEAPQNGYYLIAKVTVNSTIDGLDVNSLDFYALVNGHHYDYGDGNAFQAVSGVPPDLTTTLNTGETVTGELLFDLPSPHGQIVYAPNFNSAPIAEWSF